jgi:hypothetical protein
MIDDKSMMIALATIQANQISGMSEEIKRLRSELSRFTEGMPGKSTLDCAAESLAQWACKHADDDCAWCADTTVEWLRRLAAGGERE